MNLIILDRDGVINEDSSEYIKSADEWVAIPGSLEAIADLSQNGYRVVIATNQSGIARGKFNIEQLNAIHQKMHTHLDQYGGVIEAIFFCPHGPDDGCHCRKPKPGMFEEISARLKMPLNGILAVGDKVSDMQAAQAVGAKPLFVKTGHGQTHIDNNEIPADIPVYENLAAVSEAVLMGAHQ